MDPPEGGPAPTIPRKQIRALFDEEAITVYQAYRESIAAAAVREQRLDASSDFKPGRVTWIKPSWCWMMYRCGYSHKDSGQARVLALRVRHGHFRELLESACLASRVDATTRPDQARVQWDPERGPRQERLAHRSIQIGIPAARCKPWLEQGILSIADVTERARELKRTLDAEPDVEADELATRGLLPLEAEYKLPDNIAQQLGMIEGIFDQETPL